MNTREILQQIRNLNITIKSKVERAQSLRELAESVNAQLTGMPTGNGDPQHMSKTVELLVDLEHEIEKEAEALVSTQREMGARIANLPRKEYRDVLEMRYLNGLEWKEISNRMSYTRSGLQYLELKAIEAL